MSSVLAWVLGMGTTLWLAFAVWAWFMKLMARTRGAYLAGVISPEDRDRLTARFFWLSVAVPIGIVLVSVLLISSAT